MPSKAGLEKHAGYPFPEHSELIAEKIARACENLTDGRGRVAVAFSGGLDSSLVAALCKRVTDVSLYVAGKPGCHDIRAAVEAAEALSLPLTTIEIKSSSLRDVAKRVESAIKTPAPIEIAVAVPMAFVCREAVEGAVVTGTGADEIFGGYSRYVGMAPELRLPAMRADVARLRVRGAATERAIGSTYGKAVLHPYMDPSIEAVASVVGVEGHFWMENRKTLLVDAALRAGLPPALANAPKKAAQYGGGVARMLSSAARSGD